MTLLRRSLAVVFLVLLISAPARAQGTSGPDLVIEGTKTGTPIEQMTGNVTVIDEQTINSMQVPTVSEVLRQVPGLDVVQSGGPGGQTSLFLRGGNSNHVLVLIDGVKVNDPTTGAFDMAHLTLDQIARIEVLPGSQSPLYGSEALAGVVNIITKRGHEGANDQLTLEGGAYRTWREVLSHSDQGPIWDEALSVSRWSTRGFSKASANLGNTEPDGYANTTLAARLGRGAGVGGRLDLTLRLTDATTDFDDAYPAPTFRLMDSPAKSRDKAVVIGVTRSAPLTPWWDHRILLGWSRDHLTTTESSFDSDLDSQSRQLEWRHTLSVGPDNLLTLGYEYQSQMATIASAGEHRIVTNALFVQDQLAVFEPFFITVGGRSDDNNRFGRHNTYKIGSSFAPESWHTRVFANYGTGFRGPTLNDLYYPGYSNLALQPERSSGYEAGLTHSAAGGHFTVGATYFRTHYDNLIRPDATFTPVNVASADAKGVEATAEVKADKARIQAAYTHTGTRDDATNDQLLRRPRNKANLAFLFQPEPNAELRFDYRYVGERLDFANTLSPYSVVNLAASQALTPTITVFARVDNLFDRDYQEVTDVGTAGRAVYAGLTTNF
ncbi:MAG: TonB-dependent receptor [Nitrospirae bacterium]|nr:TonB-dependent receptor [Nitrospirota bacterium]